MCDVCIIYACIMHGCLGHGATADSGRALRLRNFSCSSTVPTSFGLGMVWYGMVAVVSQQDGGYGPLYRAVDWVKSPFGLRRTINQDSPTQPSGGLRSASASGL
jgi:hypothetical protein